MAFMTPLVKKRYDIYDAPTVKTTVSPSDSSASLHLKSLKLVNKLVRIVISGKKQPSANSEPKSKATVTTPTTPIVVPVFAPKCRVLSIKTPAIAIPAKPDIPQKETSRKVSLPKETSQEPAPVSVSVPKSSAPKAIVSPPSRPIPHARRRMRDSATNRVYSYSVSIPAYVPEEDEEEIEEEERFFSSFGCATSTHRPFISSSAPASFNVEDACQLAVPH